MNPKLPIGAGLAALVMVACVSPAAAQNRDPLEMLAEADANNDGAISWSEVVALRTQNFNRLDRNSDGVISASDRPRGPFGARFDEAFAQVQSQYDVNSDRRITRAEMIGAPAPAFTQGDTNNDGILSAEELSVLRATLAAR
jgi:hypothetical protein